MPDITQDEALKLIAEVEDKARRGLYKTYREYYDGCHDTQITARQRKYLEVKIGQEFNVNYFPVVVDALSERLRVTGFDADAYSETIWEWFEYNRGDALQAVIHSAAVRDGDAYAIAEWNEYDNMPYWEFEQAYDGNEGVEVIYSDKARNNPLFAFKRWGNRMNVYYFGRVEKYEKSGADWALLETLPWTVDGSINGQGLGLPVVHFRNRDQGFSYGRSEGADIIPVQNALNKSVIDMVAAADTTAFRIYWMLGDDPSGIETQPGSWVFSTKPPTGEDGAEIGYFPGEDLTNMIAIKDTFVTEIARISRTPLSLFQMSGNVAAEGTLKQQEGGLVARAKDRQVTFGNAWEDLVRVSIWMHNAFSPESEIPEDLRISTLWADPETRNDLAFIEMLKVKRELNVPIETLWAEMGYDDTKIEDFKAGSEYALFVATNTALMWKAIAEASGSMIPVETILRMIGFDEKKMAEFGTQRLAAIQLAQEDTVPEVGL